MGGAVPDLDWRDPGAIPCNVKRNGEQCLVVLCVPLQKSKGGQSLAILKGSHTPAVAEVQRTAGTPARLGSPVQPSGVCHCGNSHDDCLSSRSRSLLRKRSSSRRKKEHVWDRTRAGTKLRLPASLAPWPPRPPTNVEVLRLVKAILAEGVLAVRACRTSAPRAAYVTK